MAKESKKGGKGRQAEQGQQKQTPARIEQGGELQRLQPEAAWCPCDILEGDQDYLLLADVPGVESSGVDLRLERGLLQLEARQSEVSEGAGGRQRVFTRSFQFGSDVDPEGISASLDHGVLRVHLQKSKESRPRRISVQTG